MLMVSSEDKCNQENPIEEEEEEEEEENEGTNSVS